MQRLISIAMLIVVGAIIADLVLNPTGTGVLVNGVSGLWKTGLQAVNPAAYK
jgi:hypothetical protein